MIEKSTWARMKAARRWLIASPEKIPHYVDGAKRQGALDSPEDVARFATHGEARAVLASSDAGWLLGFALGPDGEGGHWQGVDFDAVEDNLLTGLAANLPGYVETSPSGKGLHAIGYGRHFRTLGPNGSVIEAYDSRRFFTVTENVVRDSAIVCLADSVENELARHHRSLSDKALSARAPATAEASAAVQISAQTVTELRSALNYMRSDGYDLWIEIGHALKSLGDTGRGLWLDWSGNYHRFDAQEAARKWDSFAPTQTGHQTVFAKAQALGWTNPASSAAQIGRAETNEIRTTGTRSLVFQSLENVQMRAIQWLWTGWIPKGYVTLIAGETGAGKSTILADITARVTTGAPWPGEAAEARREPGRVLWLGSEDSIEEMTVPRLTACGADLSKILEIRGVKIDGQHSTFSMQDDLGAVRRWLEFSRDEGRPFSMLVIDPVTSYLPGQKLKKVDLNDAGQLRSILEPWLRLAQEFNIAIVCVTHFAKDTTRSMLNRVLGSAAFTQTCRSLCAVIELPDLDATEIRAHSRALIQVKVNLPEHPGGSWKFRTVKVDVGSDPRSGKLIYATRPDWQTLDPGLTPQTAIGPSRGPVSKFSSIFASWLRAHFAGHGDEWQLVSEVQLSALREIATTKNWWDKHSGDFLEKENVGGKWFCKPIRNRTCQSGGSGAYVGEVVKLGEVAPDQLGHYPPLPPPCGVSSRVPEPSRDDEPAW